MKTKVGLWIDHTKAVIVTVTDSGEELKLVVSNVEKQLRRYGGVVSTVSEPVPPDDKAERAYIEHLHAYYDEVIAHIRYADSVLIFGPGEAKDELRKRTERNKLSGHIVGVETVDKMTDPQIVAKVRQYFPKSNR